MSNTEYNKVAEEVASMYFENTGVHFLDSGGDNGRQWQRNRKALGIKHNGKLSAEELAEAVKLLEEQPAQYIDFWSSEEVTDNTLVSSEDLIPYASTYHYLTEVLGMDSLCEEVNKAASGGYSDKYSYTTLEAERLIDEAGLVEQYFDNTYNYDSTLDKTLLVRAFIDEDSGQTYLLLAIHGGADVRGGYTRTRLFTLDEDYFKSNPWVDIAYGQQEEEYLTTGYDGATLTTENGNKTEVKYSDIKRFIWQE